MGRRYLVDGLSVVPKSPPDAVSRVTLEHVADFDLGGLRICPARRQIEGQGVSRTLEPRVMQVLVALAKCRPSVVGRDDLAAACWGGVTVGDDAISRCILLLRKLAGEYDPAPFEIRTIPRVGYALHELGVAPPRRRHRAIARTTVGLRVVPILLIALLGAAILAWKPWRSEGISVAVFGASDSPPSQRLAAAVTAKLGMLDSVSKGPAQLLDRTSGDEAKLRFVINTDPRSGVAITNLILLNERSEILWSKEFRQADDSETLLEQQLALSAGKVLECEIETMSGQHSPGADMAKLYLTACAGAADANEFSLRDLDRMFDRVTRSEPLFVPGWQKLLEVQWWLLGYYDKGESDELRARSIVAKATKVDPTMPEIKIVQSALLRDNDVVARMKLLEGAARAAPADDAVMNAYAILLMRTGRITAGIDAARQAVLDDELSPPNRETLIYLLATAGRTAEAQEELRQAETMWPGSTTLLGIRYTLALRFTDPAEAIRLQESGRRMPTTAPWQATFLQARAHRSPENVQRALADARSKYAGDWRWISHAAQVYGEFGREQELFDALLNWNRPDAVDFITDVIFRPSLRNFRRDPRFMRVAQRLGLLDYWVKSGNWPDFCFETDMPYDCKLEAKRIIGNT